MVFATFLSLYVVPILYSYISREYNLKLKNLMKKYMNQYSDKNLFISNAMKFLVFILFMPCIVFGQVRLSVEDAVRKDYKKLQHKNS
jgi:hypothetical protein